MEYSLTKYFNVKLLIALLLLQSNFSNTQAQNTPWTCTDAPSKSFDISRMSGDWYEVIRLPQAEVPACVHVSAPTALDSNNMYNFQVNFVNNVNNGWRPEVDKLSLPWSDEVQNGIFDLTYRKGDTSITVSFKLLGTDYNNIAVVCGFSDISSSGSLIKILSRERVLSESVTKQIETLMDTYNITTAAVTWVEQSEKCGAVVYQLSFCLIALVFVMQKIF